MSAGKSPRYPFSPEILDEMPEELAGLFREMETDILVEICSRLKLKDQLNEVAVNDIRALRSHGIELDEIKKAISTTAEVSGEKLDEILDDVVQRNHEYYTELITLADVTAPESLVDAEDIAAIKKQCQREFGNITGSMGFLVDNGRTMLKPAKAYQWALDRAVLKMESGTASYQTAIESAVKELAGSGIKSVSYENDKKRVTQVDVAARRAVLTGVNQLNQKYREAGLEQLETDLVEVTAHAGARDVDSVNGWENHKAWQGKVYRVREYARKFPNASRKNYPIFEEVCGYGDVTGIGGANCRHSSYAFVEGVSERTYTDEQLEHIDDGLGCTFEGKIYSAYEATQMRATLERTIRASKRKSAAFEAAGTEEKALAENIRLRRLNEKYSAFCKEANLRRRVDRLAVHY